MFISSNQLQLLSILKHSQKKTRPNKHDFRVYLYKQDLQNGRKMSIFSDFTVPIFYHHSLIISKTGMTKNQENCTEYFGD